MSKKRRRKKDKKPQPKKTMAYRIYLPKGYLRFPDGQKVELYSTGVIADVLVRDWREIRDWEFRGLIPLSPFCDAFGRRLYTKDMIRTIVRCAEEYKVPIRGKGAHHPLEQQGFFVNLSVRLERLYKLYEARLEIKLPEEYECHNLKFIRRYVLQSAAYKEYLRQKELRKIENANKPRKKSAKRREAYWRRWRSDPNFRRQVFEFFKRREEYLESVGQHERAEKLRQGRRKYYDEDGNCIVDCNGQL